MFWRRETIRGSVSLSAGVSEPIPLPRAGMLGSLILRIAGTDATGLGSAAAAWRIVDFISKIQVVVDGSKVVKSLTAMQVAALEFWDQGVMSPSRWRNYAANTQEQYFLINFGLYMKDPNIGLDLAKYNSADLIIDNTFTSSYLTSVTVDVIGLFLMDAPSSQFAGVMRTEEWRSWTTVSDEWKYNELPVDYMLRRIMLQAIPDETTGINDANMSNLMYDVKLSLDTGNIRVFDGHISDLMRENHYDVGRPAITGGLLYKPADVGADFSTGYGLYRAGISASKDGSGSSTVPTITADENNGSQTPEAYEADSPIEMVNIGLAPYYTALFKFDDDYNPLNFLDPNARKVVKLDIHTRSGAAYADGRNAIVLDRFVMGGL